MAIVSKIVFYQIKSLKNLQLLCPNNISLLEHTFQGKEIQTFPPISFDASFPP